MKFKINFSKQKFLSHIIDNNGLSTRFLYDNGLLIDVIQNNIIRNHFIYNQAGHIQQVRTDPYKNPFLFFKINLTECEKS